MLNVTSSEVKRSRNTNKKREKPTNKEDWSTNKEILQIHTA